MFNRRQSSNGSGGRPQEEPTPISTIIGADVMFKGGRFCGSGVVLLFGKIECTVEVSGVLKVEERGSPVWRFQLSFQAGIQRGNF